MQQRPGAASLAGIASRIQKVIRENNIKLKED